MKYKIFIKYKYLLNTMSVNKKVYENRLIIDLTENEDKPKIYTEKHYCNYTLEDDGVQFVKVQQCCPGCYPIFQPNQLAHMEPNGCLFYQEE
jgi:hypothetical protein